MGCSELSFETYNNKKQKNFPLIPFFFFSFFLLIYIIMLNEYPKDSSAFLVTNALGRHINLLNDNDQIVTTVTAAPSPPSSEISDENPTTVAVEAPAKPINNKKKYHCTEPGCTKSFTTR